MLDHNASICFAYTPQDVSVVALPNDSQSRKEARQTKIDDLQKQIAALSSQLNVPIQHQETVTTTTTTTTTTVTKKTTVFGPPGTSASPVTLDVVTTKESNLKSNPSIINHYDTTTISTIASDQPINPIAITSIPTKSIHPYYQHFYRNDPYQPQLHKSAHAHPIPFSSFSALMTAPSAPQLTYRDEIDVNPTTTTTTITNIDSNINGPLVSYAPTDSISMVPSAMFNADFVAYPVTIRQGASLPSSSLCRQSSSSLYDPQPRTKSSSSYLGTFANERQHLFSRSFDAKVGGSASAPHSVSASAPPTSREKNSDPHPTVVPPVGEMKSEMEDRLKRYKQRIHEELMRAQEEIRGGSKSQASSSRAPAANDGDNDDESASDSEGEEEEVAPPPRRTRKSVTPTRSKNDRRHHNDDETKNNDLLDLDVNRAMASEKEWKAMYKTVMAMKQSLNEMKEDEDDGDNNSSNKETKKKTKKSALKKKANNNNKTVSIKDDSLRKKIKAFMDAHDAARPRPRPSSAPRTRNNSAKPSTTYMDPTISSCQRTAATISEPVCCSSGSRAKKTSDAPSSAAAREPINPTWEAQHPERTRYDHQELLKWKTVQERIVKAEKLIRKLQEENDLIASQRDELAMENKVFREVLSEKEAKLKRVSGNKPALIAAVVCASRI
eukprot:GEZU01022641.1.p1 GENE.GEZU01022641.1~~GEZU01022641.1.p1  ORF type:complete len:667 (-),score=135.87 GEZU01022641.1:440-2440(-)